MCQPERFRDEYHTDYNVLYKYLAYFIYLLMQQQQPENVPPNQNKYQYCEYCDLTLATVMTESSRIPSLCSQ